jgi:hypothetical protein
LIEVMTLMTITLIVQRIYDKKTDMKPKNTLNHSKLAAILDFLQISSTDLQDLDHHS